MLSFSESVFLQKTKVMYKVSNNIAPEYLTDLFKMRESNSNSSLNLRSVSNKHFLIPKVSKGAKIRSRYNQVPHPTQDTNGKVTNSQLDVTSLKLTCLRIVYRTQVH